MTTRDIKNTVSPALSLNPAARSASANGTAVDLQGYASATMVFAFGTWTDGTHTPSLQHSADGSTNWTTCDSNTMSGTLTAVSGSGGSGTVQKVGYIGGYRYIRAVMTVSGATTGAVATAIAVRGRAAAQPV